MVAEDVIKVVIVVFSVIPVVEMDIFPFSLSSVVFSSMALVVLIGDLVTDDAACGRVT